MYTKVRFLADVANASAHYRALEAKLAKFGWLKPYDANHAYGLYKNAYGAALGFLVMGRTRVDSNRGKVQGNSIEDIDIVNLGATNHSSTSTDFRTNFSSGVGTGSVLHYTQGVGWHFLMNDSWLLGGIHARHEFHAASPRHLANMVDPIGKNITVTTREAIGLRLFGYQFCRVPSFRPGDSNGEIARCVDPEKARRATLAAYVSAIDAVSDQFGRAKVAELNKLGVIDYSAVLGANPTQGDLDNWNITVGRARQGAHVFPT